MGQRKNKPISILFIGNSFSYYHSLPKLIAYFARVSERVNLVADGVFRGGATLKMLWHDGRALKKLRSKKWDYVVLQERGRLGGIVKRDIVHVGRPEEFIAYATRFAAEAIKIGAKTILYCPPAFIGVGLTRDAKKLHNAYAMLAQRLHVAMISSGAAFALAFEKRPHMNLYERDKQHPNPTGTYLIACLFYRQLFHKKALNLPFRAYVSKSEQIPKRPRKVKIPVTDARFLWRVANRAR